MSRKRWLCPECGSDSVYYAIGDTDDAPLSEDANYLQITGGPFHYGAALDVYVCGDCGAVRTFVSNREALKMITQKWPRLNE